MNSQSIRQAISDDCSAEFMQLRAELNIILEPNFDIISKKDFLQKHISTEVIAKSELLLDTLLNHLMEQAIADLEKADIQLQNKFFKQNFRDRVYEWSRMMDNEFKLNPAYVEYSRDPRGISGLVAGGITFVAGSTVTTLAFVPHLLLGAIISGMATIIASYFAFNMAIEKAAPKSRELVRDDIGNNLKDAEKQAKDWLFRVVDAFYGDFEEFCSNNGYTTENE
jgi:hypothetical protein